MSCPCPNQAALFHSTMSFHHISFPITSGYLEFSQKLILNLETTVVSRHKDECIGPTVWVLSFLSSPIMHWFARRQLLFLRHLGDYALGNPEQISINSISIGSKCLYPTDDVQSLSHPRGFKLNRAQLNKEQPNPRLIPSLGVQFCNFKELIQGSLGGQ